MAKRRKNRTIRELVETYEKNKNAAFSAQRKKIDEVTKGMAYDENHSSAANEMVKQKISELQANNIQAQTANKNRNIQTTYTRPVTEESFAQSNPVGYRDFIKSRSQSESKKMEKVINANKEANGLKAFPDHSTRKETSESTNNKTVAEKDAQRIQAAKKERLKRTIEYDLASPGEEFLMRAKDTAKWVGNQFMAGLNKRNEGLFRLLGAPGEALGFDNNIYSQIADAYSLQAKEFGYNAAALSDSDNAVTETLASVFQSAPQMILDTALLAASGGGTLGSKAVSAADDIFKAGKVVVPKFVRWTADALKLPKHMIPMFAAQAGNSISDAKEMGKDDTTALIYGLTNGYLNALLEGGGVQKNIRDNLMGKVKKQAYNDAGASTLWGKIKSAASKIEPSKIFDNPVFEEGMEELTQGITERSLQNIQLGAGNKIASFTDENAILSGKRSAREFAGGALGGAVFGGIGKVTTNAIKKIASVKTQITAVQKKNNQLIKDLNEKKNLVSADADISNADKVLAAKEYDAAISALEDYISDLREYESHIGDIVKGTASDEVKAMYTGSKFKDLKTFAPTHIDIVTQQFVHSEKQNDGKYKVTAIDGTYTYKDDNQINMRYVNIPKGNTPGNLVFHVVDGGIEIYGDNAEAFHNISKLRLDEKTLSDGTPTKAVRIQTANENTLNKIAKNAGYTLAKATQNGEPIYVFEKINTVNVGDVFVDNRTGDTYKITASDSAAVTVEKTDKNGKNTLVYTPKQANDFLTDNEYIKIYRNSALNNQPENDIINISEKNEGGMEYGGQEQNPGMAGRNIYANRGRTEESAKGNNEKTDRRQSEPDSLAEGISGETEQGLRGNEEIIPAEKTRNFKRSGEKYKRYGVEFEKVSFDIGSKHFECNLITDISPYEVLNEINNANQRKSIITFFMDGPLKVSGVEHEIGCHFMGNIFIDVTRAGEEHPGYINSHELVHWLKAIDSQAFIELQDVVVSNASEYIRGHVFDDIDEQQRGRSESMGEITLRDEVWEEFIAVVHQNLDLSYTAEYFEDYELVKSTFEKYLGKQNKGISVTQKTSNSVLDGANTVGNSNVAPTKDNNAERLSLSVQEQKAFIYDDSGKIRFKQIDINYKNDNYHEARFNLLDPSEPDIETVNGRVVGKYGVYKKVNGYYGVTLLSSGMDIAAFATFDEALKFAAYTNRNVLFNDISYVRNVNGQLEIDATPEFMQYGEQIKNIKNNKAYIQDETEIIQKSDSGNQSPNDNNIPEGYTAEDLFIDNRTAEEVGNRKIKAFQFMYPQFKTFFKPMARQLYNDISQTIKGERFPVGDGREWSGTTRHTSPAIARIKDDFEVTYKQIQDALNRIITDQGQENTALAKRIELVIDEMLSNGYTDFYGNKVPADKMYLIAKGATVYGNSDFEGTELEDKYSPDNFDYDITEVADDISYSIDENFTNNYDKWVKRGRRNGVRLKVGSASEALRSVDVKNQNIYWDSSKINSSLKKHKYLNDNIMKQIPDILENPIIVMQSKKFDSRITMFGEVYDVDGVPIMAVLELLPTNKKHTIILDEIKVTSSHSRKDRSNPSSITQTQNIINTSNILYVDPNKKRTNNWLVANRLQLPLHITNYGSIKSITYPEGNVNTYSMQNFKNNSMESEENINARRNNVTAGNLGRGTGSGADKSGGSIYETARASKKDGGQRTGAEGSRRIYAENVRAAEGTEIRQQGAFRCEFIKPDYYTADMRAIEENNAKQGIKTYFFLDSGEVVFKSSVKFRGAVTKNGDVYIQCNHEKYSPGQINKHELVHRNYDSDDIKKVREHINNNLTEDEKQYIIDVMYARYSLLCRGDVNKIFEEFVCDVLSDMNSYSGKFADVTQEYWSRHTDFIDNYSAAEYTESIDAGGISLSLQSYTGPLNLSKQEYTMVSRAIMAKNAGLTDNDLKPVDYVYAADEFYIYENHSIGNFTVSRKISIEGNEELINYVRGEIEDGTYRSSETSHTLVKEYKSRRRSNNRNNGGAERPRTYGSNVGLSLGQSESDTIRYTERNSSDTADGTDEIRGPVLYEGRHIYSMDKWYPDLSRNQLSKLNDFIKNDVETSTHSITDTANWAFTTIGNTKVFAIYSTEKMTDPTLLYESKGRQGEFEKDYLLNLLEEWNYGKSNDGKSSRIDEILSDERLQKRYGIQNNNGTVERGQYSGNDTVLPRKSKRKPSGAFTSVIENLFKIQNEIDAVGDISFSLEDDGEFDLFDLWEQKNKEFGTIKKGENPTRDIDVPKKITKDKLVSRFARTMLEAGVTPDTAVSEFEKRILDGTMTHEVVTNDDAREWAVNQIKYHGFEEALNTWSVYTRDDNVGKKELALGMELYNQCITNGDVTNAMRIAAELVAEATHAGQTLQATRMLKLMTPDGQLYYLEKSIQKMNEEFKKKIGDKYEDIELNEELMEKFLTEKEADKRDKIYDDICQDIANQIPSTLLDKWNSWRYLAMLGNPRTHIRNIAGNAVFVPAIKLKNYIGAVIEEIAKIDTDKRTKSLHKNKKAVEFAKSDFAKMLKVLQGENAKYAVTSDIEGKRTIFKTKWLEKLRTKNFEWLEREDMWFLKMHYVDALAQLLTARKLDVDNIDEKTLDIVRAYAVREAQRATYRDANSLAEALNKLQKKAEHSDKKSIRATSVLLEGVMPFKKTPLNIAKQGVQYSPVGILTGIYKTVSKVKNGDAYSTADIIDDFAKGLTGTALMLLGTFLASLGVISGGDDENKKKKEFDKMVGEQSFSINIGDKSYTIDWAAPTCLPLFTGVELYELAKDDFKFSDITAALSSLTDPLLELSVFSGISGAIESAQYNDTNTLFAIGSDMTTSYLTQALPTIGGQISRIVDKNKREYYYTDKNSNLPKGIQSFIGQVSSKIPFASYLFEPAIDEWGREETYGNIVERTFENAVSPGYYSKKNYTKVDEEIKRLYESTGESNVLPVIQQKKYTESNVDYPMTAGQWSEAKRIRGQKSFELIEQLLSDSIKIKLLNKVTGKYEKKIYSQMSDAEKVKAVMKCYEDAGEYTKEQMIEKVKGNKK